VVCAIFGSGKEGTKEKLNYFKLQESTGELQIIIILEIIVFLSFFCSGDPQVPWNNLRVSTVDLNMSCQQAG